MAELTILLRRDPHTGKQNIIIKLDSDPDALPMEHEQMHRALVEKLIGKGLRPEDLGELIVEREEEKAPETPVQQSPEPQRAKQGQSH